MANFNLKVSNKHIQIDQANARIVIATAITTVIVVFSLVASMQLLKQMNYQNKVISARSKANQQLEANIESVNDLKTAYDAFEASSESVIGTKDKNSKIVLDSLPSKYDFPALATSLDGLITASGTTVDGISGTDNEAQAVQESQNPQPIEIPFNFGARGDYASAQRLILNMERSIRPFHITGLTLAASDKNIQARVTAKTYYQPEKKLDIEQKVVSGTNGTVKKTTVKKAAN